MSLIVIVIFLAVIVSFASDLHYIFPPSLEIDTLSKIGDSFNILNSLITLLALFALIHTIKIQQTEFTNMNREVRHQSFDNKFFQMLAQIHKISDSIKNSQENFGTLRTKLIKDMVGPSEDTDKDVLLEHAEIVFKKFHTEYDNSKIFFINLYQLLKYVNTNEIINDDDKIHYSKIVRAILDEDQLVLLFYRGYGVSKISGNGYIDIIKIYALLEHLSGPSVIYDSNKKTYHSKLIKIAETIQKEYDIDIDIDKMLDY